MKFLVTERQLKTIVNFINESVEEDALELLTKDLNDIIKKGDDVDENSDPHDRKILNLILRLVTKNKESSLDDKIDTKTKNEIKKYQKENGLEETGIYDSKTNKSFISNFIKKIFSFNKIETNNNDDETTSITNERGEISDEKFKELTKEVINKFEGGYWNGPGTHNEETAKLGVCANLKNKKLNHPGSMGKSTETMFGLDRYNGNIEGNHNDPYGKEFFAIIDQEKKDLGSIENFCKKWKWNYKDESNPNVVKLKDLATEIMRKSFDRNMKNYVKDEKTKKKIWSSPGLLLHMVYATWNGRDYFKKFAKNLEAGIDEGKSDSELIDLAVQNRYDEPFRNPEKHEKAIRAAENIA